MTSRDPSLSERDPEIARLIREEEAYEARTLRLIPSENYVSRAVLEASGSILTNKYSEGYAGKRYYEGQQVIDQVEELACSRLRELFGAEHVNVQPYSGSPANLAVYLAFCQPGDPIEGPVEPFHRLCHLDLRDAQPRTLRLSPTRVHTSSTMMAPITDPMIPEGWKKPSCESLWKSR